MQSIADCLAAGWRQRAVSLKAVSFALVGVINTAIDASVFFSALALLTTSLIAANILAWFVAVSCSYVMNSYITFAAESGRRLSWRRYLGFVASGVAGAIANTAMLVVAADYFFAPVWLAKALAILVSFAANFSLSHFVVFRPRKDADLDAN